MNETACGACASMSRGSAGLRVVGMRIENLSPAPSFVRNCTCAIALIVLSMVAPTAAFAQTFGWVGLSSVRSQYFENENLLFYVPEAYDAFGAALATGDFNGDGADDLATGIPLDNGLAGFEMENVGLVIVRYGVPGSGLETGLADTVLRHNVLVEAEDFFGRALAAGDFNGDGFDDLAVGEPGESAINVGRVHIFYGGGAGIALQAGHNFMDPVQFSAEDEFGSVLAAGNFNGDTFDDLAIGMPNDSPNWWEGDPSTGSVLIIEGGNEGLRPSPSGPLNYFLISQNDAQIPETAEAGDLFGFALAVGNFNGDTQSIGNEVYDFDDLAIGIPGEDGVGAVLILYGSQFNLLFGSSVFLGEWDLGGAPAPGDSFGYALAAADFDGNGADDLAIGEPYKDVATRNDTGQVAVLYSQWLGPFDFGLTEWWSQASIYGNGFARDHDYFGTALAAFRFDPHWDAVGEPFGIASLVIGTPGMSDFQGGFTVVRGTTAGLGPVYRVKLFGSDFGAAPDDTQGNLSFGYVFATGDFDGNGYDDLAVGHPQHAVNGIPLAGTELILYGSTFADGFEVWAHLRLVGLGAVEARLSPPSRAPQGRPPASRARSQARANCQSRLTVAGEISRQLAISSISMSTK